MPAEIISQVIVSEAEQPFFITETIPFPALKPSKDEPLEEFRTNWEMASETFVQMYQVPGYGDSIRALYETRTDKNMYLLSEIGQPFGLGTKDKVRKIRSTLKLGEEIRVENHESYWNFSDIEMVQLMVGIVANKFRNEYHIEQRKKRTDIISV